MATGKENLRKRRKRFLKNQRILESRKEINVVLRACVWHSYPNMSYDGLKTRWSIKLADKWLDMGYMSDYVSNKSKILSKFYRFFNFALLPPKLREFAKAKYSKIPLKDRFFKW